jgi:hypothetical protein
MPKHARKAKKVCASNDGISHYINGKLVNKNKMLAIEFGRIKQLIDAAKQGDYDAADELLFQTMGCFRLKNPTVENRKIIKLLQGYIGECLANCIEKALPDTSFFSDMKDAKKANVLYKAFHLNRPLRAKRDNNFVRDYKLATDYFVLMKAKVCKFSCSSKLIVFVLRKIYGIKSRAIYDVIQNKELKNSINLKPQTPTDEHLYGFYRQIKDFIGYLEKKDCVEKSIIELIRDFCNKLDKQIINNRSSKLVWKKVFEIAYEAMGKFADKMKDQRNVARNSQIFIDSIMSKFGDNNYASPSISPKAAQDLVFDVISDTGIITYLVRIFMNIAKEAILLQLSANDK